jgi:crossover junction endodeoxyribonuclease RusA
MRSEALVTFTVYGKPEPQGSFRAMNQHRSGKAILAQSNKKLLPYRQMVSQVALLEFRGNLAGEHVPIQLLIEFYFAKPKSAKKREFPSVKPDIDKLQRCILDALTGIAYKDDGQVVTVIASKYYGSPERTEVEVRTL